MRECGSAGGGGHVCPGTCRIWTVAADSCVINAERVQDYSIFFTLDLVCK